MAVRIDRPGGLVGHQNGLVGFEATNVVIRIRPGEESEPDTSDITPHLGPLSLYFNPEGQQTYEVDGRRFVVDERSYLLHNLGQCVSCPPSEGPGAEGLHDRFLAGLCRRGPPKPCHVGRSSA